MTMRILVIFILLAFGLQSQQTTVNGQQTLCTVLEPVEDTTLGASTSSATAYSRTVDCCPLSVDFYESQIRKADSLYKNYLPQSNFEEVKAAMEFFDSRRLSKTTDNSQRTTDFFHWWTTDNFHRSKTKSCTSDAYPRTVDCCPLSVDFSCAKAHYYHAVGLTEKDDIVGACEHYLIALEIMEPLVETSPQWRLMANDKSLKTKGKGKGLCDSNKEDYEKIRFMALIYTRLGKLFLNENYCDLAITKYSKALKYVEMIDERSFMADILKFLGNSYQLSNKADSALYYYNESLKCNSSLPNKLDVEKCIAMILFSKGEKDSAYRFVRSNLNHLENCSSKYSYYYTLGDMYFNDMLYDSAIYYLKRSYISDNYSIKTASSTKLSAIYESLGDFEIKAFYDSGIVKMSVANINNDVKSAKLQNVYDYYTKRKLDREKAKGKKMVHAIVISLISVIILMLIIMLLIRQINRTRHNELLYYLNEKEKDIANKDLIIEQLSYTKQADVNSYYETDICKNILYQITYKNNNKVKSTKLKSLKAKDIISIKYAANAHLNNILEKISSKYPKIDNEDLVCICLLLLNVNITDMSELLDKSYNAVWRRISKIKAIFNLNTDSNLQSFLLSII